MRGPKTLKTPRLWLRLLNPGAAPAYGLAAAALIARPDDCAHMLTFPNPFEAKDARQRVQEAQRWWAEDRGWSYGIWHGPQLIGQAQIITHGERRRVAEVAYWLRAEARGQGFVGEAVEALISQARKHWPLERVEATVVPGNEASVRVLTRLGFALKAQEAVPYDLPYQWPLGLHRLHRRRGKAQLLIFSRSLTV